MQRNRFFYTLMIGAALLSPALASPGHQTGEGHDERAYGEPGDPKKSARVIQVTMRDSDGKMEFVPSQLEIRKGEQVKFVIRNNGELDHEIVLATLDENLKHAVEMAKNPDMEHDDPNAKRLAPKKTGDIVWRFTKVGEFDFSCLIPGHREAGMFGKITVK
jgi:uncharacterized cupredoxin-like copper-binding protein